LEVTPSTLCTSSNGQGTLDRNFGSEDQLIDAALTRHSEIVPRTMMEMLRDDRPLLDTLTALINYAMREDEVLRRPAGLRLMG
jgi:hypothetical protein